MTLADRFWAKVEKTEGCWLWTANTVDGYGHYRVGRRMKYAHRLTYEDSIGPIPSGLTLDHLCRNRHCVNPAHLEPVTNRENILRGQGLAAKQARRTHCIHGHPFDAENTYWRTGTMRQCRACHRIGEIRQKEAR